MIRIQFAVPTARLAGLSGLAALALTVGACGSPSDDTGSCSRVELTGTAHATGDSSQVIAKYGGKTFTEQDFLDQVAKPMMVLRHTM